MVMKYTMKEIDADSVKVVYLSLIKDHLVIHAILIIVKSVIIHFYFKKKDKILFN
jgi:hypothetical protein